MKERRGFMSNIDNKYNKYSAQQAIKKILKGTIGAQDKNFRTFKERKTDGCLTKI